MRQLVWAGDILTEHGDVTTMLIRVSPCEFVAEKLTRDPIGRAVHKPAPELYQEALVRALIKSLDNRTRT